MTTLPRVAWTVRARTDERLLLVVDLRPLAGLAVATLLIGMPLLAAPLGRLASPFALLVVLPPLALALEAFGWRDRLARILAAPRAPRTRLLAAYAAWLLTSALLTLDVAAVAAASVGIAVAAGRDRERRWQLGSAILGSNVGSLLLPFSNLTNLVLVSATGIGFATYVGLALGPQLAAALAIGALLALRSRRDLSVPVAATMGNAHPRGTEAVRDRAAGTLERATGGIAVIGALGAIASGLAGADVAVPFAISAGILAGLAVGSGRLALGDVTRSLSLTGLAVVGVAAVANGPITSAASLVPQPGGMVGALVLPLVVGGVVAALLNNLPAAAFGAAWLVHGHPASVVAYLVGTNVVALATPHGSVATILARTVGRRHGVDSPTRAYLAVAWLYALVGGAAAFVALVIVAR